MQPVPCSQITALLQAWGAGDQRALGDLVDVLQPELHKIARNCLNNERPAHTIQATALINEAYLKLVDISRLQWRDRAHFLAVVAGVMRRVLVDYARARSTGKRGGRAQRVDFEESIGAALDPDPSISRLDDALGALGQFDSRKAKIVEMRYFGGMTAEEIAEVLRVSIQTVHRDWNLARSWLARELRNSHAS
jgi:RNA polymerase sigma factor (TIGR02999 family)